MLTPLTLIIHKYNCDIIQWNHKKGLKIQSQLFKLGRLDIIFGETMFYESDYLAKLKHFYEPSVISKHKPLIYQVPVRHGNQSGIATARMSLMNQMTFFTNPH